MDTDTKDLNIDASLIDGLTEEEKSVVFSVLKEYQTTGTSQQFEQLLLQDYREIPVDIDTFVDDNNYLGYAWHDAEGNSKLYPFWRNRLHELFPNNLDTCFNNLIESGARGLGKQSSVDALILTDHGFIRNGDLKIGDMVYGRDGKLHKLTRLFPQGIKPCYEVEFTDGSKTTSGPEHLWTVMNTALKETSYKTVNLKTILEHGIYRKDRPTSPIYKIPVCEPIQFEKTELPIDPYLLGVMLGDGCLSNNCFSFVVQDDEIADRISKHLIEGYTIHKTTKANNKASVYNIGNNQHSRWIKNYYLQEIEKLELRGTESHTKFIPDSYKYASVDSRIALLQGLMDTDGSAEPNPIRKTVNDKKAGKQLSYKLCYYTTSKQLKNDFIWLVQSLGGTAISHVKANKIYSISLNLPSSIDPFYVSGKLSKYRLTKHREPSRYISKITYLGEKDCQCILIDNGQPDEEHLYITDDFIVTHNSEIAVLVAAYLMYRLMCLKNPLEHFHMKPTEKFAFAFMNIKLDLAEEIGNSKFQNTIKLSPWFLANGTLIGRNKGTWVPPSYIQIIIGSQASDVIGQPIYFAFFDEISFLRNQDIEKQKTKAIDMINTAIGGMKTRFIYKGKNPTLLILASSKRSEKSFLEEHMKRKLKSEKENVIIVDEAVWKVKPEGTYSETTFAVGLGNKFLPSLVIPREDYDKLDLYKRKGYKIINAPIDLRPDFVDDIERALCDFAGIASSEISKYIAGQAVQDVINKGLKNPFVKEILEIGNAPDDKDQYYNYFNINCIPAELKSKPLFVHLDMSVSGDMTGIAGVWIKGKRPSTDSLRQANDLFYTLAFAVNIKAPKGRQISFEKNRNFIYWLKEQGFNIKGVTSDSYQSYDTGQALKAKGYNYDMLSVDRVDTNSHICIPYQYLKNTIYEQRVECFPCKTLEDELTDLERNLNTGKVDHPDGGRKDVADAVCGAVFNASKYAEEFAFDYGESLQQMLDLNAPDTGSDKQQLVLDMEEQLKHMHHVLGGNGGNGRPTTNDNTSITEKRKVYNPYSDIVIY